MASIQDFQNDINKFKRLKTQLQNIATNVTNSANNGRALASIMDANLSINGLGTHQATNAKNTSDFMDSISNYITQAIIPYIDYEIDDANNSINDLRDAEN